MSVTFSHKYPVVVVGSGPVGLAMSLELSRYGVEHLLVSDADGPSSHPKCNTTNARSMEHFRRLGLADKVRFGGLDADYPTDIVYLTRLAHPELGRVHFPSARAAAGQAGGPTSEPQHRISQIFLEQLLLDEADARPPATVALGQRLTAVAQDADGATVTIEDLANGNSRTVRTRWLIGCDGGRSTVRRLADIGFSGEARASRPIFGGTMVATFFRSAALQGAMWGREGFMYWTLNGDMRSVTVAIDGEDRFLTHVQAPEGVDAASMDPREFIPMLAGADIDVEILSSAVWNAGFRLVADDFVAGRVVLAGDAAHLFTPTGGFGMNTGIDDAANLAWKVAAELAGWGGPGLVSSYHAERRPVALRNTSAASEIADIIAGLRIPEQIEASGPAGEAARGEVAEAIRTVAAEEFGTVGVQLGIRYEGSPIIVADGTPPTPDERTRYVPTGRPGSRLPHVMVGGVPIHDLLGRDFSLVAAKGAMRQANSMMSAALANSVPITLVALDAEAPECLGAPLLLVRPDQHVAWRGDAAPADAAAIFKRVTGR